ncbi:DNA-binding response regulator, OmpR family, contains REC and winged-helix (wHTH) domain [Halobacillus alkaliphilus]|uniref:DNA-binding response regulator, OmpR family, contains REC and winged-helix (WHTH) domain n=1 Tax=Halobacillus alkaliphilus TaxID=396056 RepID=A0A1I2MTD9_9BACI|nr:response regulator transcription factor [Halobacillus alkaliphilus]SFF92616.1 DNA-binding response regulator, OmpR family, contains REC and winged-helix (wHTH) domain [Halobacillus alkaliphilus]
MEKERILVVEDEFEIADLVRDYLVMEGYEVMHAKDGQEGWDLFQKENPTLTVLDLMLPKLDGMELCRLIRSRSMIPIIMMTAKKSESDKIIGLGIGADDYITKPFSPSELVARIKAQLRRYRHFSQDAYLHQDILTFGDLTIDASEYKVRIKDHPIELSAREFQILNLLASHAGQVFTKEQLFDKIWGYDHMGDFNTLMVYMRKLREKIEVDPSNPVYLRTVWGVGYKFEGGVESSWGD